jgi:NADH pyrophosphatase NudC (nudix superfamily)
VKKKRIRPLAICVFRKDGRILVAEGYDPVKDHTFYRPLGGAIEFGETSRQTVSRELMEEIGAEVGVSNTSAPWRISSSSTESRATRS